MKYLTIALITVAAFASQQGAIQAQSTSSWVEVSRSDEFFRVSMPRQPVETSQHNRFGGIDANGKRYQALADGAAYTLWTFIDANQGSRRELDEYFDACADLVWESLLKEVRDQLPDDRRVKARMTYIKELPARPLPGREYSVVIGDLVGTVRFFVSDARIYILLAGNFPAGPWERERFFESFSVSTTSPSSRPQPVTEVLTAASDPTDYNRVFTGREVTQKARVLTKPEPTYTESARKYGITGTVVLRAVFSEKVK